MVERRNGLTVHLLHKWGPWVATSMFWDTSYGGKIAYTTFERICLACGKPRTKDVEGHFANQHNARLREAGLR